MTSNEGMKGEGLPTQHFVAATLALNLVFTPITAKADVCDFAPTSSLCAEAKAKAPAPKVGTAGQARGFRNVVKAPPVKPQVRALTKEELNANALRTQIQQITSEKAKAEFELAQAKGFLARTPEQFRVVRAQARAEAATKASKTIPDLEKQSKRADKAAAKAKKQDEAKFKAQKEAKAQKAKEAEAKKAKEGTEAQKAKEAKK
jgi:colicin import membrane protein